MRIKDMIHWIKVPIPTNRKSALVDGSEDSHNIDSVASVRRAKGNSIDSVASVRTLAQGEPSLSLSQVPDVVAVAVVVAVISSTSSN